MAKKQEHNPQNSTSSDPVNLKGVSYIDGPGYYSFYVNNVAFGVNPLDFVLIFGEIVDVRMPEQEAIVERRARVTMAPAQAKALGRILETMVKTYESQNGPIKDLQFTRPEQK